MQLQYNETCFCNFIHRAKGKLKFNLKESRLNVLSLSFVCGTIVQYGIALNITHLNAADDFALNHVGNKTEILKDCVVSSTF